MPAAYFTLPALSPSLNDMAVIIPAVGCAELGRSMGGAARAGLSSILRRICFASIMHVAGCICGTRRIELCSTAMDVYPDVLEGSAAGGFSEMSSGT